MIKILKKILGLILMIAGVIIFFPKFVLLCIFCGLNRGNVFMSDRMRIAQNLLFGDGYGDDMFFLHKEILNDESK